MIGGLTSGPSVVNPSSASGEVAYSAVLPTGTIQGGTGHRFGCRRSRCRGVSDVPFVSAADSDYNTVTGLEVYSR